MRKRIRLCPVYSCAWVFVCDCIYVDTESPCLACGHYYGDYSKCADQATCTDGVGGTENSCSRLELIDLLESLLPVKLGYTKLPWRHSDQKYYVAYNTKAARLLGWKPRVTKAVGVAATLDWAASLG